MPYDAMAAVESEPVAEPEPVVRWEKRRIIPTRGGIVTELVEEPEPVGDATDVTGSFLADPSAVVREPGEPPANLLTDEAPAEEPEPVGDATDVTGSFLADPSAVVREPDEPPANLLTDDAPAEVPEPVGDATDVTGSFLADPSELVREPDEPPANLLTDDGTRPGAGAGGRRHRRNGFIPGRPLGSGQGARGTARQPAGR